MLEQMQINGFRGYFVSRPETFLELADPSSVWWWSLTGAEGLSKAQVSWFFFPQVLQLGHAQDNHMGFVEQFEMNTIVTDAAAG